MKKFYTLLRLVCFVVFVSSCQQQSQEDFETGNKAANQAQQTNNYKLKSNLRYMAENFDNLSAPQLVNLLKGMNSDDKLLLSIYSIFANLLEYKICQADVTISSEIYTTQSCQNNYLQWQQTYQLSNNDWQQATSAAYSEMNQLLIGEKCSTGEIDAASCQMYNTIQQQNNQNMNEIYKTMLQECTYDGEILASGAVCVAY